ncbi:MAG: 4-alpha-glucanotransferase [Actinomycetia bacterium]|nr:4-alpha-glucanotransferase [Actinomycetes bacterium]
MTEAKQSRAIAELARQAGVLTEWVDAWNDRQQVSSEDLRTVLAALTGRRLDSVDAINDTTRDIAQSRPTIEPVLVAWDGIPSAVPIDFPVQDAILVLEDGSEVAVDVGDRVLTVPTELPVGYHSLVLNNGVHTSHVFSAPKKAYPAPRNVSGLIGPTYSLRGTEPDAGIGTVACLEGLADFCDDADIEVVGTLPLLAAFPDQPSPYSPASRRAWNEIFVDFSAIPGWEGGQPVSQNDHLWVDYAAAGYEIRSSLAIYSEHVSATPALRSEVDEFLRAEPEMRRYAAFRAMTDAAGRNWRAWPVSVAAPPDRVAYHETVQWLMHTQLTGLSLSLRDRGQYLYLDLPIGCHPDGYDIWDTPEQFAPASLGAPPDTLFVGGQDWGLPATIPERARVDGHLNFRKAIRRQLSVAGLLRIDHVMGIHRTWWVPHGAGATHGAYVMQPTDELFAIICIESVRAQAGVVGENLGTVPPEIRTALDEHELLGIAMADEGETEPRFADLVALTSHDTPAFAAWWNGNDIVDLLELGVFDEQRAHDEREWRTNSILRIQERFGTDGPVETRDALMAWMAGTDAAVALFSLDDLLMEERRQNVPGTDWERPNWRIRYTRTLDEIADDTRIAFLLATLKSTRPNPGVGAGLGLRVLRTKDSD